MNVRQVFECIVSFVLIFSVIQFWLVQSRPQGDASILEVKSVDTSRIEFSKQPKPLTIVHLDLKGAAPKVGYINQIFRLLSTLGVDGVLIEYEDMFPYRDVLKVLRSPFAYSTDDLVSIRNLATLYRLTLIPLVQVFGHLEFVLKHPQYACFREVKEFPNSLNPRLPEAVALVQLMVSQVIESHPEAQWFHMGADEVYDLGHGVASKEEINDLFLGHATTMAKHISSRRAGLKVMMWDDMLRKIPPATILKAGLTQFAVPTIWQYSDSFKENWVDGLMENYHAAGFKDVWFASSFKGSSGVDQQWTPINRHLQNHMIWYKVMKSVPVNPSLSLQGIVLTGWQRYDHFSVLCELFPVAIPSLAVCVESLKNGAFDDEGKRRLEGIIGCEVDVQMNLCNGNAIFAGTRLYKKILYINSNLNREVTDLMKNRNVKGWFSPYHRQHQFGNPRYIGFFLEQLRALVKKWDIHTKELCNLMEPIYFLDAVNEWIAENIDPYLEPMRQLLLDAENIVKLNGQPKT